MKSVEQFLRISLCQGRIQGFMGPTYNHNLGAPLPAIMHFFHFRPLNGPQIEGGPGPTNSKTTLRNVCSHLMGNPPFFCH